MLLLLMNGEYRSYWSATSSYEVVVPLINMDFDGLKTSLLEMLSGTSIKVNTKMFQNDTVNFKNKDDVFTYLVHLGYLGYKAESAFIPKPEYIGDYPLLLVELKWNKSVKTALQQIKDKEYPESVSQYAGELLLVGISYDKKNKKYQCMIEKYMKE